MEEKITAWIARDRDNFLALFTAKPIKMNDYWDNIPREGVWATIPDKMFPNINSQVKWEDEEPTKVELTIKIE